MFGLRLPELLLILAVVVVLFGAKRLPQLGSAIGESLKGFKKSMREVNEEEPPAKSLPRNETAPQSTATKTSASAK
ncbi:MAG TPA: twin-arginine translocase TatA/TatE family subunit [Anaeromyxobacteraceae bacterium]|nr:twin-arginine translocase TatA/TatE family subunit [Anaeromyxobacteraceae bacterium]